MGFGHKVVAQRSSGKINPSKANADKHVVSGTKSMGTGGSKGPMAKAPSYAKGSKGC